MYSHTIIARTSSKAQMYLVRLIKIH